MSIAGILIALACLMALAFRGWSILVLAPGAALVAAGALWWVWAWAAWVGFMLLMMVVFPTVIAPWFNRFEPLADAVVAGFSTFYDAQYDVITGASPHAPRQETVSSVKSISLVVFLLSLSLSSSKMACIFHVFGHNVFTTTANGPIQSL